MYRRQSQPIQRFFRKAWMHTQAAGRQLDNFVRKNSEVIRTASRAIAPLLAPEAPGAAAAIATIGQGAASYSQLRDALDRAAT